MRALASTALFLLASLRLVTSARAGDLPHVSLTLPRLGAVQDNELPRWGVTNGPSQPPPPTQLDATAFDRVEHAAEMVTTPQLRNVQLRPYAPYLGCYGISIVVETDRLLR
jgi:hypothetical protein